MPTRPSGASYLIGTNTRNTLLECRKRAGMDGARTKRARIRSCESCVGRKVVRQERKPARSKQVIINQFGLPLQQLILFCNELALLVNEPALFLDQPFLLLDEVFLIGNKF